MDEAKCKASVYRGCWSRRSQCDRKPWKDGWCKQHHPDSVKARREASDKRWEEKRKQTPWHKLQEAQKRIAELEAEVASLRSANAPHQARAVASRPECGCLPSFRAEVERIANDYIPDKEMQS